MGELEGKVVIITGGAKGIGRKYSEAFCKSGARVAIADIDQSAAETVAAKLIKGGAEVIAVKVDVADLNDCRSLTEQVWKQWRRLDVLVNNAAIYSTIKRKPFIEISGDEWDQVMAVNLKGMFFCAQAVFPYMKQQGSGKIINISSSSIFKGSPFFVHYVTSKAGVIGMTRALARESGEFGICVNAVSPGLTVTEENIAETPPDRFQNAVNIRCIKRQQIPEDLVGALLFLASSQSDFITGQLINVDGGGAMY
jgi:3-oxoacyl-[acyl-carrier protein] reductase